VTKTLFDYRYALLTPPQVIDGSGPVFVPRFALMRPSRELMRVVPQGTTVA
jgi:hypothetical protein